MTDILEKLRAADDSLLHEAAAEIADLRSSVIAFGATAAAVYSAENGWPANHLHPVHFDILARAGARMTDFVRHEEPGQ